MNAIKRIIEHFTYKHPQLDDAVKYARHTDRYTMQSICVSIAVPTGNYVQPIDQTKETIALLLAKEIVKSDAVQLRSSIGVDRYTKKETYCIYVAKELIKDVVSISG